MEISPGTGLEMRIRRERERRRPHRPPGRPSTTCAAPLKHHDPSCARQTIFLPARDRHLENGDNVFRVEDFGKVE